VLKLNRHGVLSSLSFTNNSGVRQFDQAWLMTCLVMYFYRVEILCPADHDKELPTISVNLGEKYENQKGGER